MENYVLEWSPVWLHHKIDHKKNKKKRLELITQILTLWANQFTNQ
jgi:hypothetical protein